MAVAFGRYELLKKIASGGMGQVFLGRTASQGFQKLVVIKRILPHLVEDEEFLTMFFEEARIAARLNHPNLVQIFDLDEVGGMHYLAMEYVAGDDVRRVEKASRKLGRTLPPGIACRIVSDAAAGLDYAHKARDSHGTPLNLIHRDVSPQNILVGFDGGVKLIDFGVARAAGRAQHTATGILKGKYPYMSPEQIAGEEYDHRSDQFALGTVFWEILTNRRLFKGESDLVTMRLVRECNVPAPSSLNPEIPPELDAIVLRALAPKSTDRFADCGELRMALEEFIVGNGIPASSAHLSAYMREIYAERIEQEADVSSLDELSGASAFDDASFPSDSRFSKAVPAQEAPPQSARTVSGGRAPATSGGHFTQPLSQPNRAGRGLPMPVMIGAVVVLLAAAVAIPIYLKRTPPEQLPDQAKQVAQPVAQQPVVEQVPVEAPVVPNAQPPKPEEAPAGEVVVAAAEPVRIQLVSRPLGAKVTVDGKVLGVTPLDFALAPGTGQTRATFVLRGYEPHVAVLTAEAAPRVAVNLKRRPKVTPDEAPLGIKTGR